MASPGTNNLHSAVVQELGDLAAIDPAEQEFFNTRGGETDPDAIARGEQLPLEEGRPAPEDIIVVDEPETVEQPVPQQRQVAQQQKPATPEPRTVPLPEHIQERQRRQAAEARAIALEQENTKFREFQTRINERLQMAQEQAEAQRRAQIPDPEQDPLGHLRANQQFLQEDLQRQSQTLQYTQQQLQEEQQRRQQEQQQAAEVAQVQAMVQDFASRTPDYQNAVQHVVATRANQLNLMGYQQQEIASIIQNEAAMVINGALRQGHNPGEVLYKLGQQMGYQVPNPAYRGIQQGAPRQTSQERLSNLQRGQQAATTLSNMPSVPTKRAYSLADLATMPQDDFDILAKRNPDLIDQLMRGMG